MAASARYSTRGDTGGRARLICRYGPTLPALPKRGAYASKRQDYSRILQKAYPLIKDSGGQRDARHRHEKEEHRQATNILSLEQPVAEHGSEGWAHE